MALLGDPPIIDGCFDAAYEFDAPRHYDFDRLSVGESRASAWFDLRQDDGMTKLQI